MKHETNGHSAGRHDPPATEPPDALTHAEDLRLALSEALTAANKLVLTLKQQKKEKKALANVYAGLRALNLGSGSQP